MKLISYRRAGKQHFGAVAGDGVIELTNRVAGAADLAALLANAQLLAQAKDIAQRIVFPVDVSLSPHETPDGLLTVYVQNTEPGLRSVEPGTSVHVAFAPETTFVVELTEEEEPA